MNHIEVFTVEAESFSPGGKNAIGLKSDGETKAICIGSGDTMRDAKAAALRNARMTLRALKNLSIHDRT